MRTTVQRQDTPDGTDWDVEAISIALARHEDVYRIWFKGEMRRAFTVVGGKLSDEAQEPPTV